MFNNLNTRHYIKQIRNLVKQIICHLFYFEIVFHKT